MGKLMARKKISDSDKPFSGAKSGPMSSGRPRGRPKKNAPVVMPRHGGASAKPRPEVDAAAGEATSSDAVAPVESDVSVVEAAVESDVAGNLTMLPEGRDNDFLVPYFKDLTRLTLLSPAAEYELARRIGIMEEVQWVQVLSFAPLVPHIVSVVEHDIGKELSEFRAVAEAAATSFEGDKPASKKLAETAAPAAAKLRQLDLDRLYIT